MGCCGSKVSPIDDASQIANANQEINRYKSKLSTLERQLEVYKQDIERGNKEIADKNKLAEKMRTYENKIKTLETQLETHTRDMNKIRESKNENDTQKDILAKEIEKYENKVKSQEKQLELYKNKIKESDDKGKHAKLFEQKKPVELNIKIKRQNESDKKIIQSLKGDTLFHDPNFEYFDFLPGKNDNDNSSPVQWLRPNEIVPNPTLGMENISPNEVQQGTLGEVVLFLAM